MPTTYVHIYEVPNSYVSNGTTSTIMNEFIMKIVDDDARLDATNAADSGADPVFSSTSFGTASGYRFFYNDTITINGTTETVKTFQLTIGGTTRSFIMNDAGNEIVGANVGNTISLNTYSNYTAINYTAIPCFCAGTMIDTPRGAIAVEHLRIGDMVLTVDNGPQPIRWVGNTTLGLRDLLARPEQAPIRIAKDTLGKGLPDADLFVSPQHRILLEGWALDLAIGEHQALCAAKYLTEFPGIKQMTDQKSVQYFHLMFDHHEILVSNGLKTESFLLGDAIADGMPAEYLAEINSLFPDLRHQTDLRHIRSARPVLKRHEIATMARLAA